MDVVASIFGGKPFSMTRRSGRQAPPSSQRALWWTLRGIVLGILALWFLQPNIAVSTSSCAKRSPQTIPTGHVFSEAGFRTNLNEYHEGHVPRYARFEFAFDITKTTATNPYFPYDPDAPEGIEPGSGISVDALLLPPGEVDWARARVLPCFYFQPVEAVGSGEDLALHPMGDPEWRCRFTPDAVGSWRYKVRATDAEGTSESREGSFECVASDRKGFVHVSETDSRFFEFADGTPFVTPLINVEQGSPFNSLPEIRANIREMGESGVRFVRWFPTGEGSNYAVAPYADTMRINWRFGDGWVKVDESGEVAGKQCVYQPYYHSTQTVTLLPASRYRLSFWAEVVGEQVLRAQIGGLGGGTIDICSTAGDYHLSNGETCTYREDGWRDYEVIVDTSDSSASSLEVGLRGLYVSLDATAPYDVERTGRIWVHSIRLQRDETGEGDWGGNLLTRSDPDTHTYVDQQAAAMLDEVLKESEVHGVYHKLTLFHKNDALLARLQPDGTVGDWDINNFYSDEGIPARWYEEAYVRYFIARWSYSTALHSLELANENDLTANSKDAAFAIAYLIRDISPRHILLSNSFWGWWVDDFWLDPHRDHLMDYSDKHWYANEDGVSCDSVEGSCELISDVWCDSAAYVRECVRRFDQYRLAYDYDKPIVRGEGGVAHSGTQPQHPDIAKDPGGTYYHKKLWAHVGVLGDGCDGEWYPRLFVGSKDTSFPNADHSLYAMFSVYEAFLESERTSTGTYVEIGTDLADGQHIAVKDEVGDLRGWGVQDTVSGRTLLWVDNAAHTWKAVVDGAPVMPASGELMIPGLEPGESYAVEWWDPYGPASQDPDVSFTTADTDGILALTVEALDRDTAIKVSRPMSERCYLPWIVKQGM
jgi:hypothetical protein